MLADKLRAATAAAVPISIVQAGAVGAGSNSSLALTTPSLTAAGNLMVAVMGGSFSGGSSWTNAGWIKDFDRSGNGGLGVFHREAVNGEAATHTFNQTNSNNYSGGICSFGNANFDVIGTSATDLSNLVVPSVTSSTDGSILLAIFQASTGGRTFTTPSGMTLLLQDNNGTAPSFAIFYQFVDSGATGTRTSGCGTSSSVTGVLMVLKPL